MTAAKGKTPVEFDNGPDDNEEPAEPRNPLWADGYDETEDPDVSMTLIHERDNSGNIVRIHRVKTADFMAYTRKHNL